MRPTPPTKVFCCTHRAIVSCCLSVIALLGPTQAGWTADTYLGAAAILQKISNQEPVNKAPDQKDEIALLRRDLAAFQTKTAGQPPELSAREWLALVDRFFALPADKLQQLMYGGEERFGFLNAMSVLPPPPAWPALMKAIEARPAAKGGRAVREFALRLLANTLIGDKAAQRRAAADFDTWVTGRKAPENQTYFYLLEQLLPVLNETDGNAGAVVKRLERQFEAAESENQRGYFAPLPDLVTILGRDQATVLLRRALKLNTKVQIEQGDETAALARNLAIEMVAELKVPQWALAHSMDALALYEALDKRFATPASTNAPGSTAAIRASRRPANNASQEEATTYYLLNLIVANRPLDAVKIAQKIGSRGARSRGLPDNALKALVRAGHSPALFSFFDELLKQNPALPFWEDYLSIAAQAGQSDSALRRMQTTVARTDLNPSQHSAIRPLLYKALLAADKVEEGVKELRTMLAAKQTKPEEKDQDTGGPTDGQIVLRKYELSNQAITLARIGHLLDRKPWIDEGIQSAKTLLAAKRTQRNSYELSSAARELATFLGEIGRGLEAEEILAGELMQRARAAKEGIADIYGSEGARDELTALAALYHRAGRHADVLALLDRASNWGAQDLVELDSLDADSKETPLSFMAADALTALNRPAEARPILDALLDARGGFDPAYALLLKIGGDNVTPRLEGLFRRDQFEERPLIWKAHGLRLAGKLDEAEKITRQAIAIDPSDGEQPRGDRMRVYTVLADILEARGDVKQAQLFRGVVRAIRLSEDADQFYHAGLLRRGIEMYQKSLTFFADAYCIQSRMAVQLSELGQHEAAAAHYRKAFELMPDSFGRVESHCFGCEHAFDGAKAQGIAEKVFTELVAKTPNKPQLHYLLGYLRQSQGRNAEALPLFRKAVALDPDYLNAWKILAATGNHVQLSPADRDNVTFNLLRLDPLLRHVQPDLQKVSDLKKLWTAMETVAKFHPPAPKSLYPLAASKAALEKEKDPDKRNPSVNFRGRSYRNSMEESYHNPGTAIAQHQVIRILNQLLDHEIMRAATEQ